LQPAVHRVHNARYLQLSYNLADLLSGPSQDQKDGLNPGSLSLAAVHVVAEVTP